MLAQRINAALRPVPPVVVYCLGLVPLALLIAQGVAGGLGVDPVKTVEHRLGEVGLQLLVAGLCVTPLRWVTGVNLIRYRRAVGVLSFVYVALHLLTWLLLDLQLRWSEIGADLVKRPYIILGMLGFAAMVPLAATSNNASVRRMGAAAWQKLHRLTYVAALAGALHYMVLVKAWPLEPMLYLGAVAGLLAWRWLRATRRRVIHTT
jgi:sulfoxide reductase heme-binding subunit YedZ